MGEEMNDLREQLANLVKYNTVGDKDGFAKNPESTADAIIAALPGMVRELSWREVANGWSNDHFYITQIGVDGYRVYADGYLGFNWDFDTSEDAKAAAQAHYVTDTLARLGLTPPPQHDTPTP